MSVSKTFLPRIWANGINNSCSTQSKFVGQCDCDCECYPRTLNGIVDPFERTLPINRDFRKIVFKQADYLTISPFLNEYWLAYPKGVSARMAVLNQDAATVFHLFSTPSSINDLCMVQPYDSAQLLRTATQMYSLGLLDSDTVVGQTGCMVDSNSLVAWLHVTQECNLDCSYCYLPKQSSTMEIETLLQAIRTIFRSAEKHGMQQVVLKYAGGEPALYLQNILQAQNLARNLSEKTRIPLQSTLITNGLLVTQNHVKQLLESGIRISVSLDGLEQYHNFQRSFAGGKGSFKQVQASIESMQKNGISPHIIVTVTGRNIVGLPDLVAYLLDQDLTFNLNYYRENENSACYDDLVLEETSILSGMRLTFDEIEANLPRWSLLGRLLDRANIAGQHLYPCGVGRNYLVFDTEGKIAKCQMDMSHSISSISADDPLLDIRGDIRGVQNPSVETKPVCQDCEWRYWCAGGCPLINKRIYGSYNAKSPYCSIYRALFPEVLRLEALRLLKYEQPWS